MIHSGFIVHDSTGQNATRSTTSSPSVRGVEGRELVNLHSFVYFRFLDRSFRARVSDSSEEEG